jgi:hypothetical protein
VPGLHRVTTSTGHGIVPVPERGQQVDDHDLITDLRGADLRTVDRKLVDRRVNGDMDVIVPVDRGRARDSGTIS